MGDCPIKTELEFQGWIYEDEGNDLEQPLAWVLKTVINRYNERSFIYLFSGSTSSQVVQEMVDPTAGCSGKEFSFLHPLKTE